MPRRLVPGKLRPPQAKGLWPRERLFAALDEACEKPAVWVSGPAGAGKTSLAASYIEARKLLVLWYQVDSGDADPASFFHYLGLAARKGLKPLPRLTPERRSP